MIDHPSIEINDVTYQFDHLSSFSLAIDSRRAGRILVVRVNFTNHCYTIDHNPTTHPQSWPILRDGGRRARTFCPERYELSRQMLPALVQQMNHPQTVVQQTNQRRNWVYSTVINTAVGTYNVFFELRRSREPAIDLEMIVESAYARLTPAATLGPMGFALLCGKVFRGDPVATRR